MNVHPKNRQIMSNPDECCENGRLPSLVVIDPHADDADWWTGGLALLLKRKGWAVHFVCVGPAGKPERAYAAASAKILDVTRHYLDIPINGNLQFPATLRRAIPPLLHRLKPTIVLIPSLTDYHQEHVVLARELFRLFHPSARLALGTLEVYAYDSHENRDPIEISIDISAVWKEHLRSLRCFRNFERPTIPDNTLIRVKAGRAMMLGASLPAGDPVHYAEGYRLLQGDAKRISSLPAILPAEFFFRSPHGLLRM